MTRSIIVVSAIVGQARAGAPARRDPAVKTILPSLRVSDLTASLAFYGTLGYGEVGRVEIAGGTTLTMLKFPAEQVVSLELVHRPGGDRVQIGTGFSHLAIQVGNLPATVADLTEAGLEPGPVDLPGGPHGPHTSWVTDPDGYRIELVQWPAGHPDGITAADFDQNPGN